MVCVWRVGWYGTHLHRIEHHCKEPPLLLQVFKEEEEAVKVDLHENSGRVKLYWIVALADSKTLKGMVEFRETGSGL